MMPDLTNSPIMVGHDCTQCHATIAQCNQHIQEHGSGCCSGCFLNDTHGLLRDLTKAPAEMGERMTEAEAQIVRMTGLLASFVISRSEHAKGLRRLGAHVAGHDEPIARLEAENERLREQLAAVTKRLAALENDSSTKARQQLRLDVNEVDERLTIVERCLPELERKLGLKRRPGSFKRQAALPPGPPTT